LKREEDAVRNQDKNAMAADSWYLPQTPGEQYPFPRRRRDTTLAVEQAAASDSKDRTCPFLILLSIYMTIFSHISYNFYRFLAQLIFLSSCIVLVNQSFKLIFAFDQHWKGSSQQTTI
jgi:hypothetical protein